MNKTKFYLILVLISVVVAAFLYWQFLFYRSPMVVGTGVIEEAETSRVISETNGVLHSIPLKDIIIGNPVKDGIPSIDEPVYESVAAADQYLDDDGFGLVVEVAGDQRFYPYQILVWHEIVNDTFNGEALLVTYCPLCYTGIVFEREINGEIVEFGTSGKLYNSNLLMYDRWSDSLWSQALGEAVVGALTGAKLTLSPSLTISWLDFKSSYPSGEVLSRDTGYVRDYTRDPYGPQDYYTNSDVWFPLSNEDGRLSVKTIVFGLASNESYKAYALDDVEEVGLINDAVGGLPVVIFWDPEISTVRGFSRQVQDDVLNFEMTDDFLVDSETGSLWNYDGEAVSGDYRGDTLKVLSLENSFWFSWAATHPETEVFEGAGN